MLIWENENYKIYKLSCIRCGCFVLQYHSINILIDTSMKFERNRLLKSLKKDGIHKIDAIILTHYHFDHAANAAFLSEKFQCRVYASHENLEDIRNGRCNLPKGNNLVGREIYRIAKYLPIGKMLRYQKVKEIEDINNFMKLGVFTEGVKLVPMKGHTKDGIALIIDHKAAIVGDAFVRNSFAKKISLPWADHPEEIHGMWTSLYNEGCEIYLQSHGAATTREMIRKSIQEQL